MPDQTPELAIHYPAQGDALDVVTDDRLQAESVENVIKFRTFPTRSDRDVQWPNPPLGALSWTQDVIVPQLGSITRPGLWRYGTSEWTPILTVSDSGAVFVVASESATETAGIGGGNVKLWANVDVNVEALGEFTTVGTGVVRLNPAGRVRIEPTGRFVVAAPNLTVMDVDRGEIRDPKDRNFLRQGQDTTFGGCVIWGSVGGVVDEQRILFNDSGNGPSGRFDTDVAVTVIASIGSEEPNIAKIINTYNANHFGFDVRVRDHANVPFDGGVTVNFSAFGRPDQS